MIYLYPRIIHNPKSTSKTRKKAYYPHIIRTGNCRSPECKFTHHKKQTKSSTNNTNFLHFLFNLLRLFNNNLQIGAFFLLFRIYLVNCEIKWYMYILRIETLTYMGYLAAKNVDILWGITVRMRHLIKISLQLLTASADGWSVWGVVLSTHWWLLVIVSWEIGIESRSWQ